MLTQDDEREEKEYLKKVISVLNEEISKFDNQVKYYSQNIQEQMSYAWDKTNRLSDTEFIYAVANIQKRSVYAGNANKKINNYKQMLNNTYFARIDFTDDETGETWPIYIGIASLTKNDEFFVYDWRAPISSMFYNYEVGKASYEIATGEKITGKIVLKRQFKIQNGEIKEVFDTDLQIIDNVLKGILSSNASHKMKNIVTTIQKEQNEIIRKNNADIFVVQGPAGSGKTSIAMHKIAYLLYAERDKISNSNVMILSPNEIFNNYISDVLPEIGEDNVAQATFMEFAKNYISEFSIISQVEDVYEAIYASKNKRDYDKINELKFKYDEIYLKILDKYIDEMKFDMLGLDEVVVKDEVVMKENDMREIAKTVLPHGESVYLQGKRIVDKIYFNVAQITQKQLTTEKLKRAAIEGLSKIKLKVAIFFKKLFEDKNYFIELAKKVFKENHRDYNEYNLDYIFENTSKLVLDDKLEFQDATPFMYFKSKIIGISPNKHLMYVLIDEAQDYSLAQYKILSMLFRNSNMTILGDLNQSILPFNNYKNYDGIIDILTRLRQSATTEKFELSKTYRSTYEINDFAKRVIAYNNEYNQIDRHGDKVFVNEQKLFNPNEILLEALKLKREYNTVAVICKNIDETLLFNEEISKNFDNLKFRIVAKTDNVFVEDKIMIIPSYLSKGLEFDAVIISNANAENYSENERNLFYVVVTRALHKLEVYYSGEKTKLLK